MKREHLGYTIKNRMTVNGITVVIGHNPAAAAPWACWYCKNDDFYWGIYCTEKHQALKAYTERLHKAAEGG